MQKIVSCLIPYLFLVKLNRGGHRVKLTKYDTGEWDEECRYASDILFEWSLKEIFHPPKPD